MEYSEMIACYQEQPEGVMLYPGETRYDVLSRILTGSMDSLERKK